MKAHKQTDPVDGATVVLERMFDAPRELVWSVFTTPKYVAMWYGGHGFSNPVCEMDVRPGGLWRHVMRTPDGAEFAAEYVFLEVVRPHKLVWQRADHEKLVESKHPSSIITVTLEDAGKGTKWRMVARFHSIEDREIAQRLGFSEVILEGSEKLAEIATGLQQSTLATCHVARDTFATMLGNLAQFLDVAEQHANARGYDASVLMQARLAPDMFTLAQQVQMACFYAEDATARLTGAESQGPKLTPVGSLGDVKNHLTAARARLARVPESAFEVAETRVVRMPIDDASGLEMQASEFVRDWALPHFYFHIVTAYDILRHNGVALGKRDYAGHVGRYLQPRPNAP
jgi:hypothetical protein